MTRTTTATIAVAATLVLAVTMLGVAQITPTANAAAGSPAAVLAFVTSAAVGIERAIEILWTIWGGVVGTYWPMTTVRKQVDSLVRDLDVTLQPFHDGVSEGLAALAEQGRLAAGQLGVAQAEIARLKGRFDELKALAPDNQRVQLLVAAAAEQVGYLQRKYEAHLPHLREAGVVANEVINGLRNFLASFKDNPGRRLISLYLGAILGLAVAGMFGLDLFQAALQIPPGDVKHPRLNVILTGLILGLGSNPTHEVIRAIQEYKKNRKGENIAKPDQSQTAAP